MTNEQEAAQAQALDAAIAENKDLETIRHAHRAALTISNDRARIGSSLYYIFTAQGYADRLLEAAHARGLEKELEALSSYAEMLIARGFPEAVTEIVQRHKHIHTYAKAYSDKHAVRGVSS